MCPPCVVGNDREVQGDLVMVVRHGSWVLSTPEGAHRDVTSAHGVKSEQTLGAAALHCLNSVV